MVAMLPFMYYMMYTLVDKVMVDDEVVQFMKSNEKYDVCVVEVFNMEAIMVKIFSVDSSSLMNCVVEDISLMKFIRSRVLIFQSLITSQIEIYVYITRSGSG